MEIEISHSDLKKAGFEKGQGAHWYNPKKSSDEHAHLMGTNTTPGYDPVTNKNPPEFLKVEKVEIKVSVKNRWWGDKQRDGTFAFKETTIKPWGADKTKAEALLAKVPAALRKK